MAKVTFLYVFIQIEQNLSLELAKAVIVADAEGKKMFAKYFGQKDALKDISAFERKLFDKTKKTANGEIIMLDGLVVVYKNRYSHFLVYHHLPASSLDVFIYIVGGSNENEIMLFSALQSFYEALNIVYKTQVEKSLLIEQPDLAFLTLDETFEEGILIECDPGLIAGRVTKIRPEDDILGGIKTGGLNEQTLTQALIMAKEQLTRSLMK